MKQVLRAIIYFMFVALLMGFVLHPTPAENFNVKRGRQWDEYVPALAYRLKSINSIVAYVDSAEGKTNRRSLEYVRFLSRTVSDCFFHGYSFYSFRHNWIAYLAGRYVWLDLDAIVIPDDILKHPYAACSQTSIVLAACLKNIGVAYRKVGLKGHFVLEARVADQWYLFDPNLEPHFPHGRKSLQELLQSGDLYAGYAGRLSPEQMRSTFSRIEYGSVNAPLAPRATVFHRVTYFLSIVIAIALSLFVIRDVAFSIYKRYTQFKNRRPVKKTILVDGEFSKASA